MVLISLTSPLRNVDMRYDRWPLRCQTYARFSSDADIVRLTNARIIIIIMVIFQAYKHHTAHRSHHKLDDPTCDLPQQANSLCHVQGEPTAAVALLYMAL